MIPIGVQADGRAQIPFGVIRSGHAGVEVDATTARPRERGRAVVASTPPGGATDGTEFRPTAW